MKKFCKVNLTFRNICLCCLLILSAVIFIESCCSMLGQSKVILEPSKHFMLCIIPGVILLSAFFLFIFRQIDKIQSQNEKKVMWVISGLILLLQGIALFVLIKDGVKASTDTVRVIDQAIAMVKTQDGKINNETVYFGRYGNNYPFTVLLYYICKVIHFFGLECYTAVLMVLNVILMDISGVFAVKLIRMLRGDKWGIKVLVLFLICPTTYVWIPFTYTNTFSLPFIMGVLYFGIKAMRKREHRILNGIVTGILGAVGYQIRATTIIPVIAVILGILLTLRIKRVRDRFILIFIIAAILAGTMMVSSAVCRSHLKNTTIDRTFPPTHWVMMGLNRKSDGFVNDEDVAFSMKYATKDEKFRAHLGVIKKRLKKMGPIGYAELLVRKLNGLWALGEDGYQNWYGNGEDVSDIFQYINGDKSGLAGIYCQVFRSTTFLFIILSVLFQLRRKGVEEFFVLSLTLLGAILFFLLWETNKKYNICFMGIVLILAGDGITHISKFAYRAREQYSKAKLMNIKRAASVATLLVPAFLTILMILDRQYYLQKEWDYRKIAVQDYCFKEEYKDLVKEGDVAEQTFVTAKKFNEISISHRFKGKAAPDSYRFELLDAQGNMLASQNFPERDQPQKKKKNWKAFDVPEVSPDGGARQYTIRIVCQKDQPDGFFQMAITPFDSYDLYTAGNLNVNREQQKRDMTFRVAEKTTDTCMNRGEYILAGLVIWLLYGFLAYRLFRWPAAGRLPERADS